MRDVYLNKLQEMTELYQDSLKTIENLEKEKETLVAAVEKATRTLRELRENRGI